MVPLVVWPAALSLAASSIGKPIGDETGIASLGIWSRLNHRYHAQSLIAHGHFQRAARVVHVAVDRLRRLTGQLAGLELASRDVH